MFSFDKRIASRGYHVYRNLSWKNAKAGQRVKVEKETSATSKSIDPYACAIKIKNCFFDNWITVGHIPREEEEEEKEIYFSKRKHSVQLLVCLITYTSIIHIYPLYPLYPLLHICPLSMLVTNTVMQLMILIGMLLSLVLVL